MLSRLAAGLTEIDERFVQLGQSGSANANEIGAHVDKVRDSLRDLFLELEREPGRRRADWSAARNDLSQALTAVTAQLNTDVPAALAQVGEQAEGTKQHRRGDRADGRSDPAPPPTRPRPASPRPKPASDASTTRSTRC